MKLIPFDYLTKRCSLRNCKIEVDYCDVCQVGGISQNARVLRSTINMRMHVS